MNPSKAKILEVWSIAQACYDLVLVDTVPRVLLTYALTAILAPLTHFEMRVRNLIARPDLDLLGTSKPSPLAALPVVVIDVLVGVTATASGISSARGTGLGVFRMPLVRCVVFVANP